jgi:hypothetical protein
VNLTALPLINSTSDLAGTLAEKFVTLTNSLSSILKYSALATSICLLFLLGRNMIDIMSSDSLLSALAPSSALSPCIVVTN